MWRRRTPPAGGWSAVALGALLTLAAPTAPAWADHPFDGVDEVQTTQRVAGEEVVVSRHGDPLEDFTDDGSRSLPAVGAPTGSSQAARDVADSCTSVNRSTDDTTNAVHPAT